jgi:hypothetical protein
MAFAARITDSRVREMLTESVLWEWMHNDPHAACEFIVTMPPNDKQKDWLHNATWTWFDRDAPSAMAWAKNLPDGPLHDAALKGVCEGMARADPRQAATLVASLPTGDLQSEAARVVVGNWAHQDINAAADWVASFPESKVRGDAAEELIRTWVHWNFSGPGPAERWLASRAPSPSRDQAARAFVKTVAWHDSQEGWELAAKWVSALADEKERNEQIEKIAGKWVKLDEAACRAWLEKTGLPSESKQKILAQ